MTKLGNLTVLVPILKTVQELKEAKDKKATWEKDRENLKSNLSELKCTCILALFVHNTEDDIMQLLSQTVCGCRI